MSDTIFALSSGAGRAAVAVIRISGSRSSEAVLRMTGRSLEPRLATLVRLRHPVSAEMIDDALCLWFPGPHSFTGEDSAEFHVHGGRAGIAATLGALGALEGCRLADAGEFTRRAFANGKLDLTRVEGLADLIDAETQTQRNAALQQVRGGLERRSGEWRQGIIHSLALLEATIDFSDEAEAPTGVESEVEQLLSPIAAGMRTALAEARVGERIRDGYCVLIAGPPNAGKSSLLNAIVRRDVMIVSEVAGTTRDLVETTLDVEGLAVTLIDSAGIRKAADTVEKIGVRRALDRARSADLVLWVTAPGQIESEPEECLAAETEIIRLVSKGDILPSGFVGPAGSLIVSSQSRAGLAELMQIIRDRAVEGIDRNSMPLVTRERQRLCLERCAGHLECARELLTGPAEIVAEELRLAADSLASLVGAVDVEEVLDEIFSRFCMGK